MSAPDRDAGLGHVLLDLGHPELAEVEQRCRQDGIGSAFGDRRREVVQVARPARGDEGHGDDLVHRPEQVDVVAVLRAVAVHGGEQDLPRSQRLGPRRPLDGVDARRPSAAVGEDFPALAAGTAAGVDGADHALGAELLGPLGQQLGAFDRGGVDRYLVRPGPQQPAHVVDLTSPPADRERDEDALGRGPGHLEHRLPALVGRGDIEEHHLVGPLPVVERCELDGIPGIDQVDELHALDHPSGVDVEAGDHPFGQHERQDRTAAPATAASASSRARDPEYSALPTMTPSRRGSRRDSSVSTSASPATPPEAMRPMPEAASTSRMAGRFGPSSVPSRPMSVNRARATPAPDRRARTSPVVREDDSCQPATWTIPLRASTAATRLGPKRGTASERNASSIARVPTTTRAAPAVSQASMAASDRIPPATWTGTSTASMIPRITAALAASPPNAASRSTTCSHVAPRSRQATAVATGSSL